MPTKLQKTTILLVEDEALIAMGETELLDRHGYTVRTVYSGEEAIAAVDTTPIDLILMDIDLGKDQMEGTEAAETILQHHEVPIIFLTSHTEQEVVRKVKDITSYGYVVKNTGDFVLLESIEMALELFAANQQIKKTRVNAASDSSVRSAPITPTAIVSKRTEALNRSGISVHSILLPAILRRSSMISADGPRLSTKPTFPTPIDM